MHNFRDDGAKEPHLGLELRLIVVQKLVEMVMQALPKGGILGFPRPIDFEGTARPSLHPFVSSGM
jgi:hypothetical protein